MLGIEVLYAAHALDELRRILAKLLLKLLRSNKALLYHGVKQRSQQRGFFKPCLFYDDNAGPDAPLQHGNPMRIRSVGSLFNAFTEQTLEPAPVILLKQRLGCLDQFPVYTVIHTDAKVGLFMKILYFCTPKRTFNN